MPEIYRELGISTATFYKWRSKCGSMDVSLMARMKQMGAENAWLRKAYVEEKLKTGASGVRGDVYQPDLLSVCCQDAC